MDNYKLMHRCMGHWWLYGYCETLEELYKLNDACRHEGWCHRKAYRWDDDRYAWIEIELKED